jgi:hypothetical protein
MLIEITDRAPYLWISEEDLVDARNNTTVLLFEVVEDALQVAGGFFRGNGLNASHNVLLYERGV